jgi:uncharacterized membrane protein
MSFLIFVLSLVGFWISVYFTGVYYKWFQPNVVWIPQVCQLKESSCMMIIDTPRAKLFGVPNSVFGIGLYAYLILNLFVHFPVIIALVLLSFAVIRSIYLAYSLIFVTKVPCPLCFTSHVINIILLFTVFQTSV